MNFSADFDVALWCFDHLNQNIGTDYLQMRHHLTIYHYFSKMEAHNN